MRLSKKLAAIAVVAGVAVTASAAFAFFTASGSGTGSATVGSSTDWRIDAISTDTADGPILPGSGSNTISYTVTNDSDGHQGLGAVAVSVVDDGSGNVLDTDSLPADAPVVGCLASWFVVDNGGHARLGDYAGGQDEDGSAVITLTNDDAVSQDDCKNVSPKLSIDAS